MRINSMSKIYEWCPFCCDEVALEDRFETQICPNCGEEIRPCCLCLQCVSPCPLK